jgi:hypothetical protein
MNHPASKAEAGARFARDLLRDLGVLLVRGLALSLGAGAVLFVIFYFACGRETITALWRVRSALLIVGALLMLVSAGLLFFRRGGNGSNGGRESKANKADADSKWTRAARLPTFRVLGAFPVLLGHAVLFLLPAALLDWALYNL